ncbi:serine/threonine-protein phosphatase 6 regulatory ankyrin repeat subunit B isoform X4 [Cherax quadricarinatus]|uniref:serine/threonine-protein phosphatase 6 regulatory ankyrin repeat subunit B isoform X4 n=1 Tax=Cherax quadricarinatus TaxID=27406 RepID=UPI00387E88AA
MNCEEVQMETFWSSVLSRLPDEVSLNAVSRALEAGAPVDGEEGALVTPLQHAAVTSNLCLARILCDNNANLELRSSLHGGRTAMHLATVSGNEAMVQLLVAMGSKVDSKDDQDKTPLHVAAETGNEALVELMLSCGSPVDAKDVTGFTPAQYAAKEGHTRVLELLIAHGASLHTLDQDEATLLHLAAERGHLGTVCMLLQRDVSPDVEDKYRCKAEDRAHRRGWADVVALLQNPQEASAILVQLAREYGASDDTQCREAENVVCDPAESGAGYKDDSTDTRSEPSGFSTATYMDLSSLSIAADDGDTEQGRSSVHTDGEGIQGPSALNGGDDETEQGTSSILAHAGSIQQGFPSVLTADSDHTERRPSPAAVVGGVRTLLSALVTASTSMETGLLPTAVDRDVEREALILDAPSEDGSGINSEPSEMAGSCDMEPNPSAVICHEGSEHSPLDRDAESNHSPQVSDAETEHSSLSGDECGGQPEPFSVGAECCAQAAPSATTARDTDVMKTGSLYPKLTDTMFKLDGVYLYTPEDATAAQNWSLKQELNNKLVKAAAEGRLKQVETLVAFGADLTSRSTSPGEEGLQTLHLACWGGHAQVVKKLLELGIDPRAVAQGREGVHWAAFGGHVPVLRVLKDYGCDITVASVPDMSTPLHLAADNGNLEAVRWLVQNGALIHVINRDGFSPLQMAKAARVKAVVEFLDRKGSEEQFLRAAACGMVDSVKKLIEEGVNVNAGSTLKGQEGWRALHLAADAGHKKLLEVLLQAGVILDTKTAKGMTATQLAVQAGHLDIVQLLLTDMPTTEEEGIDRHLVHWAAVGGYVPVLKYLQTKKYNLKALTSNGETTLHLAADHGNLEAVRWLVKEGININMKERKGLKAEDLARRECNKEVASFLCNLARDQEMKLLEAAVEGNTRAVTKLLHIGVNVDCKSEENIHSGNTPMHWAALAGHIGVLCFLRANSCSLTALNHNGENPLHFAATGNHPQALQWLLERGVDRNVRSSEGITAEDIAKRKRHQEAAQVLHNFGRDADAITSYA